MGLFAHTLKQIHSGIKSSHTCALSLNLFLSVRVRRIGLDVFAIGVLFSYMCHLKTQFLDELFINTCATFFNETLNNILLFISRLQQLRAAINLNIYLHICH